MEFLSNRKITYEDSPDGLLISIPAPKIWPVLIFLAVWLVGWALGEWTAITSLLDSSEGWESVVFMMIWLIGWTVGGSLALAFFLFMAFGKERILIRPDAMYIRKEVLGIGPSSRYDRGQIRDLKILDQAEVPKKKGQPLGRLSIMFGEKRVTFGLLKTEDETTELLGLIRGRLGL